MKVLLLSTGFTEYMICLANALGKHAEVSLLLGQRGLSQQHRTLVDPNVKLLPFAYVDYKSIRQNFSMLRTVLKIIRQERPDVLHIQANAFRLFWLLYPFLTRLPVVDTVHDPTPHSGDQASPEDLGARRAAIRHCKAFFVHGNALGEELQRRYSVASAKIHVIQHGEFSLYKHWRRSTVPTRHAEFLFFGRIWPYKGLDVFIDAANRVAKILSAARFTIAGTGENIGRYLARIESPDRFDVRNFRIDEADLDELFQRCFAVVLPYTDATQSGVIPIAYAYGKPVIASRVGALPEVVLGGVTGYLVDPRDPESLTEAMVRMASDDGAYRSLCAGALSFAHEELNWSVVARKSMDVYRAVLAARATGDT